MDDVAARSAPSEWGVDARAILRVLAFVAFLAAAAAAAGSYYDESASVCGSLLHPGRAYGCAGPRGDRARLTFVATGVGVLLLSISAIPIRRLSLRHARRRPWLCLAGLLAPGIEIGFIVLLRRAWGPTSEEYTGMPYVWAPVAVVAAVLAVALVVHTGGLIRVGQALWAAAIAVPTITLIQVLSADLQGNSHGIVEPARLPFTYPVGQEHPLALSLSGVAYALILLAVSRGRDHAARGPSALFGAALFATTSALTTALLVIDASPDAFAFAPLGRWVWGPALLIGAAAAAFGGRWSARRRVDPVVDAAVV